MRFSMLEPAGVRRFEELGDCPRGDRGGDHHPHQQMARRQQSEASGLIEQHATSLTVAVHLAKHRRD